MQLSSHWEVKVIQNNFVTAYLSFLLNGASTNEWIEFIVPRCFKTNIWTKEKEKKKNQQSAYTPKDFILGHKTPSFMEGSKKNKIQPQPFLDSLHIKYITSNKCYVYLKEHQCVDHSGAHP